jgi:hypothetical protein
LVDETLESIKNVRDAMNDSFLEEQWRMVKPIPYKLDVMFPHEQTVGRFVGELRRLWFESWQPFFSGQVDHTRIERNRVGQIVQNGGELPLIGGGTIMLPGVRAMFLQGTRTMAAQARAGGLEITEDMLQCYVAVEVARRSYSGTFDAAEKNLDGDKMQYRDGLLWTDFMAKAFVGALKAAELTGIYLPVKFDKYVNNLRIRSQRELLKSSSDRIQSVEPEVMEGEEVFDQEMRTGKVQVLLVGSIVKRARDLALIGYTLSDEVVPDGEYTMVDGLIVVREASAQLTGKRIDMEGLGNPVDLEGK